MPTPFNVEKETQAVFNTVKNAGVDTSQFSMEVKLFADVSGSFQDEYRAGLVDPFFNAAKAIANAIDPDKKVQVVGFSDKAADTGDYEITNENIVQDFLNRSRNAGILWSGTDYAKGLAILREDAKAVSVAKSVASGFGSALKGLFGSKPSPAAQTGATSGKKPWLVMFVSDGEDFGSESKFNEILKEFASHGIFTVLIGANSDENVTFSRLVKAAKDIDGVTFHRISDITGIQTTDLYAKIFNAEFVNWYSAYKAANPA